MTGISPTQAPGTATRHEVRVDTRAETAAQDLFADIPQQVTIIPVPSEDTPSHTHATDKLMTRLLDLVQKLQGEAAGEDKANAEGAKLAAAAPSHDPRDNDVNSILRLLAGNPANPADQDVTQD